jgi:glucosamine--fructose-6-phosphate aminotransferase (isomerizing)
LSDATKNNGDSSRQTSAMGAYSLAEILSQPKIWGDCLKQLEAASAVREIGKRFSKDAEWMFIGCGSSYYIALTAAASWTAITGTRARAIPASELLLFPDLILAGVKDFVPVLISRSGYTSEVLRAAEFLNQQKIPSIAVSCATKQKLEDLATISILLPAADEQSTVMTRAFTSMLLALQYLGASLAGDAEMIRGLTDLPVAAEKLVNNFPEKIRGFVNQNRFSDYVCLGQGPYYGLACESALKLTEMSCSFAQCFHTLEFRHGPKSIVSGETLIAFLLSEANDDAEVTLLEEVKALGGVTLAVANRIDARGRASADLVVELESDLPEYSRLAWFAFTGQLMGLYTALLKGLDPDRPKNLSRVVVLDDQQPDNAAV